MKLKTKAGLLQILWYIIFVMIIQLILLQFIKNGIYSAFLGGFLGVLLAPKIKIVDDKIVTKWIWDRK